MNEFSPFNDKSPAEENNLQSEETSVNSVVNEKQIVNPEIPPVNPSPPKSQFPNSGQSSEKAFEHDMAIGDRFQNFSSEILRLALLGIGAVGFLLLNFLSGSSDKSAETAGIVKKTLANSDFRFYVYSTLILFGISAGLALLHRYFAADSLAYHLNFLRLTEKLRLKRETPNVENVAHLIQHSQRGFFDGFWLYLFGAETHDDFSRAENEREARNFLFRISRWLLFLSGLLLWLGAFSLVLAFGIIFKQFGS